MKAGIAFSGYYLDSFENNLRSFAQAGFECVDFQDPSNTDCPLYTGSFADMKKEAEKVSSAVRKHGLTVSQTHGPWVWPPKDYTDEDRAALFVKMVRCLEINAVLGCPYAVIHPLFPFGWDNSERPDEFFEINLDFFGRLTREAEKLGVTICFENMPMKAIRMSVPEKTAVFIKAIDSPNFKMCLDTGHVSVFGISPAESLRSIGTDMIRVLHVHDNDGVNDRHMLPFCGVIDWEDFRKALADTCFTGAVSLETDIPCRNSKPRPVADAETKALKAICDYLMN